MLYIALVFYKTTPCFSVRKFDEDRRVVEFGVEDPPAYVVDAVNMAQVYINDGYTGSHLLESLPEDVLNVPYL